MTTTSAPRIDSLQPGTKVVLDFAGKYTEEHVFQGIRGEGDSRVARFDGTSHLGGPYSWEAYRYNGRWAFGTSAEWLRLDKVVSPEPVIPDDTVFVAKDDLRELRRVLTGLRYSGMVEVPPFDADIHQLIHWLRVFSGVLATVVDDNEKVKRELRVLEEQRDAVRTFLGLKEA